MGRQWCALVDPCSSCCLSPGGGFSWLFEAPCGCWYPPLVAHVGSLMPLLCYSTAILLPLYLCHSSATLPTTLLCHPSATPLLLSCCPTATLLPLYCHSFATILPLHRHSTATLGLLHWHSTAIHQQPGTTAAQIFPNLPQPRPRGPRCSAKYSQVPLSHSLSAKTTPPLWRRFGKKIRRWGEPPLRHTDKTLHATPNI